MRVGEFGSVKLVKCESKRVQKCENVGVESVRMLECVNMKV